MANFFPARRWAILPTAQRSLRESSICATGVQYRRLNLPNEEKFFGAGLYYGAGVSEATLCENDDVAVVGGWELGRPGCDELLSIRESGHHHRSRRFAEEHALTLSVRPHQRGQQHQSVRAIRK